MMEHGLTPARSLARQAAAVAAVTVILSLVSLVSTPFIFKHLGDASYGVLTTITLVSSYLLNLEFGFGYATVRFLAKASAAGQADDEVAVADTSRVVFAAAAIVGGGALCVFAGPLVDSVFHIPAPLLADARRAFTLGGLILAASFTTTGHSALIQARGRLVALSVQRLCIGLASTLAAVVSIAFGGRLVAVVATQCVVAWIGALSARSLASRALGRRPALRVHKRVLRAMASYSGLSFAAGLAYQLMMTGPAVVLAARVSTAALPAFAIPNVVLQRLSQLVAAASASFFPFASAAAVGGGVHLQRVFRSHTRLQFLLAGPIAAYLAAFGKPLLAVWISADFALRAATPLTLMTITALLLAVSSPAADVARAYGHPGWVVLFTTTAAATGIALSLRLSTSMGATGAAIAFTVSLALSAIPFTIIVASRLMNLSLPALLRDLSAPALAVTALWLAWAAVAHRTGSPVAAISAGALLGCLYVVAGFRWLLQPAERQALAAAVALRPRR